MHNIVVTTNQKSAHNHPAQPDIEEDGSINEGQFLASPKLLDEIVNSLNPLSKQYLFTTERSRLSFKTIHTDEPVSKSVLKLAHSEQAIDNFENKCIEAQVYPHPIALGREFYVGPNSFYTSATSVNAALIGAKKILSGEATYSLVLASPAHHHSGPDSFQGLCGFNGTAIAGFYLHSLGKLPELESDLSNQKISDVISNRAKINGNYLKIAFFDADAHSGNGTVASIKKYLNDVKIENQILFTEICTLTTKPQYKAYPSPLHYLYPDNDKYFHREEMFYGTSNEEYLERFKQNIFPKIFDFNPDALVLSWGFDNMIGDPVGDLGLSFSGTYRIIKMLCHLNIPILIVKEGGYDSHNNRWGVMAILKALHHYTETQCKSVLEKKLDIPYLRSFELV